MIVVIADDLSGAAEIAGIAHRHGRRVEVSTQTSIRTTADVLVLDTANRDRDAWRGEQLNRIIGGRVARANPRPRVFKKVDSALRGHITQETHALKFALGASQVLFMPANPGRNRVIREGQYYVNGTPLHQTAFVRQSTAPIADSRIESLLDLNHRDADRLPWLVPDIESAGDIQQALAEVGPNPLVVGAAEAFEHFLLQESPPTRPQEVENQFPLPRETMIINGSLMPPVENARAFAERGIPTVALGENFAGRLATARKQSRCVAIEAAQQWDQIARILDDAGLNPTSLHFALTGGATAATFLQRFKSRRFTVNAEQAPGVVTLLPASAKHGPVTLKPGSYAWPSAFLDLLCT